MAAPAVARSSGPPLCPSFAEVCSFLERYGAALDLPEMTFPQMERYLRDTTAVPKPLVELHVKLLRKLGRSVTTDRWEKYLAKVCQELNSTWAWELEQKGYQEMSMECKSSILKYLCECQFDDNLKFKMVVNDEDPEKMRLQPIGRDQQGLMYWLQLDQEQNIRLYTEEQDDLDGSTWKCIVRTRNDLAEALELLKAQIESSQCQDQDKTQNQTGSRSTSPADKDTVNEDCGAKNAGLPKTSAEQNDNKKAGPAVEKNPTKQEIKEEEIKQETPESKTEEKEDRKLAAFDNRVSTITAVKSEPRDADGPRNAVSVLISPSVSLTKLKEDEAERAAVRSNQQAKIPLKKRDLKLAGCFHTNHLNNTNSSSIIVCNPLVINSKDCRGRDGKLLNSLPAQGSPGSSQQQQEILIGSKQELTNGRTSHLPLREGHNGVIGQVGVVSHVGVIRSPSELYRAPGAEENGPKSEPCGLWTAEEGKEVNRQSVVVRKGQHDQGSAPAASALPAYTTPPVPSLKLENKERKGDSVGFSSLTSTEPSRQMVEDQNTKTTEDAGKGRTTDRISHQPREDDLESGSKETREAVKEEPGINWERSGKVWAESGDGADKPNKKDQLEQGVNGGLVSVVKLKKIGFLSEQRRGPLEEASSEIQKEGIRLKIKIPPHRRNKLRRKEGKEETRNREQEAQNEERQLRRSARICRSSALPNCRPSSKVSESQKKKPQKKQTPPARMREEEEEEMDEEEDDEEQSSPSTKNQKHEPAGKFSKRRGKRRQGRPRWTNVRPKRHKPNEEGEERGKKPGEEEEEEEEKGGSASEEELWKSEEIPAEDACTSCGLPNHPELILLCDLCDRGYHTACLRPPLMLIPDGEWFCPPCQHKMLCEKLEEQLQNLDSALKKKERAERRRERLVYVGISVENIIPEGDGEEGEEEKSAKKKDPKKSKNLGRRSTRTRKHISYRFDDFDDAIDEAIEEDIRDISSGAETDKETPSGLSEVAKETQRPIRTQSRVARNKKKRRLNDLESDSTAVESEEEFMLSNSSEEEEFAASGADDAEDEEAGSDGGSWDRGAHPKRGLRGVPKHKPRRVQRRGRKRRRRRSSEEEEETDIEMDSDRFSDMTDSDADKKRRGLRRGQRQQVNYRETSESSDNSRTSIKKEQVKRRGRPRKEHFSSDYSNVSASSRDSEEEDDYEEEEEDGRRRGDRRRRRRRGEEEELRRSRTRERRERYKDEEHEEGRRRLKRRQLEKEGEEDRRRPSARTDRDEEDAERMGRGKRREMLSQQRRKRLAQMLKKRRPSTEDESESETDDSQSSSGDDRPIRKRLNRIDSDEEEDERIDSEDEADKDEGQKMAMMSKKSSAAEWRPDGGAQEKGRGRSPSPSNGHHTTRDPLKSGSGDKAGSGGRERPNGPIRPTGEEEEEEGQSDSSNSAQNSPQS